MGALTVVGAIFAGVGALFVALGIAFTRANRRFERSARRSPGEVTDLRWRNVGTGADAEQLAFPVLRFSLPDGRVVETVARTTTSLELLRRDTAVTVLYDPADPTQARIEGPSANAGATMLGAVFIVLGAVFVVLGIGLVAGGIALDDALPDQ